MTASLNEARRFVRLAQDDFAAFWVLVKLPQIRQGLAFFHAQHPVFPRPIRPRNWLV